MSFKATVRTDLPRPSFGRGLAHTLDIFGRFGSARNRSFDSASDARSIENDWRAIGKDLGKALEKVKSQ